MTTLEQLKNCVGTYKIRQNMFEYENGSIERQELEEILKQKETVPLSLESYSLDDLVTGAIRISLDPQELKNEKYIKEYNEQLQILTEKLYLKWKMENPDELKNSLMNIYPSITYDLVDYESYGY